MLIVIAVVVAMVLVASSGDTKNACGEVGCSKSESPTFSVKATRAGRRRSPASAAWSGACCAARATSRRSFRIPLHRTQFG